MSRSDEVSEVDVRIVPWSADDMPVVERSNTPEMTEYLGGPETPAKVVKRHAKFLRLWESGEARMFTIRVDGIPDAVGSVGYWMTTWHDVDVYESGWSVATAHQGRGFASKALAACLEHAAKHGNRDTLVAFPRIDNGCIQCTLPVGRLRAGRRGGFRVPARESRKVNAWRFDLAELRAARG